LIFYYSIQIKNQWAKMKRVFEKKKKKSKENRCTKIKKIKNKKIKCFSYFFHTFLGNRAWSSLWLLKSTHVFFQCTTLLNHFRLLWTKPLQFCKDPSIVTFSIISIAIREILKEKVLTIKLSFQMRWTSWRDDKKKGAKEKKKKKNSC
jgi:hypothetical protein